jgi:HeH/LEM domain
MEFFHGVVALLAGLVLVLSGLVVWLYVQQSRQQQAISAIAVAITTPPPSYPSEDAVFKQETPDNVQVDDRVTVEDEDEDEEGLEVEGEDMTDLKSKTVLQLREMLTDKGIPFNKSDKKSTLISLVQAAS